MKRKIIYILTIISLVSCAKDNQAPANTYSFYTENPKEFYVIESNYDNSATIKKLDKNNNTISYYHTDDNPPTTEQTSTDYGQKPVKVNVTEYSYNVVELKNSLVLERRYISAGGSIYTYIEIFNKSLTHMLEALRDTTGMNDSSKEIGYWNETSFYYYYYGRNEKNRIIDDSGKTIMQNFNLFNFHLKQTILYQNGQTGGRCPSSFFFKVVGDKVISIYFEGGSSNGPYDPLDTSTFYTDNLNISIQDISSNSGYWEMNIKSYFKYDNDIPIYNFQSANIENSKLNIVLNIINKDGTRNQHFLQIDINNYQITDKITK